MVENHELRSPLGRRRNLPFGDGCRIMTHPERPGVFRPTLRQGMPMFHAGALLVFRRRPELRLEILRARPETPERVPAHSAAEQEPRQIEPLLSLAIHSFLRPGR